MFKKTITVFLNWKAAVFFSAHVFIGTAASYIRASKLFWHQKETLKQGLIMAVRLTQV